MTRRSRARAGGNGPASRSAARPENSNSSVSRRRGHPIWTEALLDELVIRYPKMDVTPWREALSS